MHRTNKRREPFDHSRERMDGCPSQIERHYQRRESCKRDI